MQDGWIAEEVSHQPQGFHTLSPSDNRPSESFKQKNIKSIDKTHNASRRYLETKLDDALWAYHTAIKTPLSMFLYKKIIIKHDIYPLGSSTKLYGPQILLFFIFQN